jgi:RNA polymerase sigma-70 factor (ECF subfamily)
VVKGDREAFSTLVERHSGRYYGLAYRTLFNKVDAEEITQEAFLKLWQRPGLWDETKNTRFSTWFYRVVANLCIDRNRKKTPVFIEDIEALSGKSGDSTEETILLREKRRLADSMILELPENQRMALNLCFYEGLSNKEAAEVMGLSLKALQSLIIRAKSALKEKAVKANR